MKVDEAKALSVLSQRLHFDFSGYSLDAPVPEIPETHRGQTFNKTLLGMARREKMTLRDLFNVGGAARGHLVIYGGPRRIARLFVEWVVGGVVGRVILVLPHLPAR